MENLRSLIQYEDDRQIVLSSDVKFYTIEQCMEELPWGERTVQKLFNYKPFPMCDYGKAKIVEAHALINFFSVRHEKALEQYWR